MGLSNLARRCGSACQPAIKHLLLGDKAIECLGRASAAVELAAREQLRLGCLVRRRRAGFAGLSGWQPVGNWVDQRRIFRHPSTTSRELRRAVCAEKWPMGLSTSIKARRRARMCADGQLEPLVEPSSSSRSTAADRLAAPGFFPGDASSIYRRGGTRPFISRLAKPHFLPESQVTLPFLSLPAGRRSAEWDPCKA